MSQTAPEPREIADLYLRSLAGTEHFIQGDEAAADEPVFDAEPVARIHLPCRVPYGFHGSWVGAN